MQTEKRRAHLIDMIRGLLIMYVVVYHLLYDLTAIFNVPMAFFWSRGFQSIRVAVVMGFLFISGMVSAYSRSGLRRCGKLVLCAAAITAVSFVAMPDAPIYFGVIHLYAVCALLYHITGRFIKAPAPWIGAMLCICAFMVLFNIADGYLYFGVANLDLPRGLYETGWLVPFGFPSAGFRSSDYYPVLPWACMFFAGAFYAQDLKNGKLPDYFYESTKLSIVEKIGRNTLAIYMIHQPVIMGLLYLIFSMISQ